MIEEKTAPTHARQQSHPRYGRWAVEVVGTSEDLARVVAHLPEGALTQVVFEVDRHLLRSTELPGLEDYRTVANVARALLAEAQAGIRSLTGATDQACVLGSVLEAQEGGGWKAYMSGTAYNVAIADQRIAEDAAARRAGDA